MVGTLWLTNDTMARSLRKAERRLDYFTDSQMNADWRGLKPGA
jgi:hypothetical protein